MPAVFGFLTTLAVSAVLLFPGVAEAKKRTCPADIKNKYQGRLEKAEAIV